MTVQIPFVLNRADVALAALQAYREGRLQYQQPDPGAPAYTGPCVIGVALTVEQREYLAGDLVGEHLTLANHLKIDRLVSSGRAITDDLDWLAILQRKHDILCFASTSGPTTIRVALDDMLRMIDPDYVSTRYDRYGRLIESPLDEEEEFE